MLDNKVWERMLQEKEWLKETGKKISELRKKHKEYQRAGYDHDYWNRLPAYFWRGNNYNQYWTKEDEENYKKLSRNFRTLESLKWDYRHRHIAYSELRGNEREKIEKHGPHNEPNERKIKEYKTRLLCGYFPSKKDNSEIPAMMENMIAAI